MVIYSKYTVLYIRINITKYMMTQFVQLCNNLKDPIHLARFQQICGVHGTFSRNPVEIRGVERGHLHNVNGISHLQGESEKCIVNGGGEGEKTDSLRQRKVTSPGNSWIQEGVDASQNGAIVIPAAVAMAGHSCNGGHLAGAPHRKCLKWRQQVRSGMHLREP